MENWQWKKFDNMEFNNWYRLITGSFFHHSVLHLLGNSLALYFVGMILENKIGSWTFLFIYFLGNVGTSIIYSLTYSYTGGNGASPGIYALIACMVILFLHNRSFINLQFGNWPVNFYASILNENEWEMDQPYIIHPLFYFHTYPYKITFPNESWGLH